jgi:glutamine synthetase
MWRSSTAGARRAAGPSASGSRALGPRTLAARAEIGRGNHARLVAGPRALVLLLPDPHARLAAVELDGDFVVEHVLADGYGACTYVFGWDVERNPIEVPALARFQGGYGDLLLRPDLASLTPIPGRAGALFALCDAEWQDGTAVDVAPRHVLRTQLLAAEQLGLVPSVGVEHEVVFTDPAGAPLTEHGVDYAIGGTERLTPLLDELRTVLDRAGLGVESARAECHPGQYEIVLRHRDALAACDDAMLQQLLVRRVAARHGARASYLAAEAPGQGSSCHVHMSVNPLPGSEPSDVLRSFMAGVLRAAGDLTAVFAPTVNSYVRLRTGAFSPRLVRWGVDDRTAAVRLVGRGDSRRIECRFAGADAQPHLVVAALLAAGLEGVRESLTPPPPGKTVDELARTPWEALARLTSSELPARLLGNAVVEHQAALLTSELDAWCDAVTDWQRRRGALRS